jgi:hypothetical protein
MIWLSGILASAVPLVLVAGLAHRIGKGLGIGWQFIRFTALATGLPIIGVLALNGVLAGEAAAAIVAGAMGYAFAQSGRDD